MPVIKAELPMCVGNGTLRLVQHQPLSGQYRMKWCARQGHVKHKLVEIGQDIPAALYQSVAEVLAYIYKLKRS